jgi:hypothetical protein
MKKYSKSISHQEMKIKTTMKCHYTSTGGERGQGRIIEGVNIIKIYYIYVWKCHKELPYTVQLMCANINVEYKNVKLKPTEKEMIARVDEDVEKLQPSCITTSIIK